MNRLLIITLLLVGGTASACTIPTYEAEPVSPYQWQLRQERIQREQAERERLCATTRPEDPRKEELCRGVAGAKP